MAALVACLGPLIHGPDGDGSSCGTKPALQGPGEAWTVPQLRHGDRPGSRVAPKHHPAGDQARSYRSRFMTLTQAATKSLTNFSPASSLA